MARIRSPRRKTAGSQNPNRRSRELTSEDLQCLPQIYVQLSLGVETERAILSNLWNFVSASVPGASHLNTYPQSRCQDYVVHAKYPPTVVACDGAGSSINSDLGSQLVAKCAVSIFQTDFFASQLSSCSDETSIKTLSNYVVTSLASALGGFADVSRLCPTSLQTTIAAATLNKNGEVFWIAVGDSGIIIRDEDTFFCSFEDKEGPENETNFIGSQRGCLKYRSGLYRPKKLLGIACLTDGAQFGLISGSTSQPGQALKILFNKVLEGSVDSRFLLDFLASRELWDDRHRDDRSIAIAAPSDILL